LRVIIAAAAKESDSTSRRQKRKAAAMREQGLRGGGPRPFGEPGAMPRRGRESAHPSAGRATERDGDRLGDPRAPGRHLDAGDRAGVGRRGLRTAFGNEWSARTIVPVPSAAHGLCRSALPRRRRGRPAQRHLSRSSPRRSGALLLACVASRRTGRPPTDAYLLTGGLLVCGECGHYPDRAPRRAELAARTYSPARRLRRLWPRVGQPGAVEPSSGDCDPRAERPAQRRAGPRGTTAALRRISTGSPRPSRPP
jgi:hypothetical protein